MKTQFKERLEHINGHMNFCKVPKKCTCGANDRNERITKLVVDVVLKAIGEDIDGDKSYAATEYILGHHDRGKEIKAKLFAELGIKEK